MRGRELKITTLGDLILTREVEQWRGMYSVLAAAPPEVQAPRLREFVSLLVHLSRILAGKLEKLLEITGASVEDSVARREICRMIGFDVRAEDVKLLEDLARTADLAVAMPKLRAQPMASKARIEKKLRALDLEIMIYDEIMKDVEAGRPSRGIFKRVALACGCSARRVSQVWHDGKRASQTRESS